MGTFLHPITISGPNGEEAIEALVDTEAMFAVVPAPLLARLGVPPIDDRGYRGRSIACVQAELAGEPGWIMIVFGDPTEQARIGSHTLDSFILDVDPSVSKLVPKVLHEIRHF